MQVILDSHCHFDMVLEKGQEPKAILAEMKENGVAGFIQIGADPVSMQYSRDLAANSKDPLIWYTVGAHPGEAEEVDASIGLNFAKEAHAAGDKHLVAIGEVGLDYYYHPEQSADGSAQKQTFEKYLNLATELNLPVCIHTRDAHDDTLSLLRGHKTPILIHCFTGNNSEMQDYLNLGCFISFSGIVTFKSATQLQEAALHCPLERILVETDAPFLAPVPHRGKVNRPGLVRETLKYIANLRGIDEDLLARATFDNTVSFYRLSFSLK